MELSLSIPGSFLPEHDHPVRPTLTKPNVNPSLFRPPPSPSASSSLSRSIRAAIPRTVSTSSEKSRKRARIDSTSSKYHTPRGTNLDDALDPAPSPAPLVNTDYRLAGGLDTPTAERALIWENDNAEAEQDYRPSRFSARFAEPDGYFPQTPSLLSRDGNGHKRTASTLHPGGWSKAVWACTGGLAGKVISFCWSTAFRGFRAGGGQAYDINTSTPSTIGRSDWIGYDEKDVFNANYRGRGSTPLPGQFPPDTFVSDYMSNRPGYQDAELSTPTQYNEISGDSSVLGRNWVFVKESDTQSRDTSPVRKKSRWSTAEPPRPLSRASISNRPRLNTSRPSRSNASFASPRGNGAPPSSRSSTASHSHSLQSPSLQNQTQIPGHRRSRSSIASPRRADSAVVSTVATSTSPEVAKYEKKVLRQAKDQDENLRRLNRQLKDMIREGRQALGTRVEIQDPRFDPDIEDEGYEEGSDVVEEESRWWN